MNKSIQMIAVTSLLAALGCGASEDITGPFGTVTGKATYKGAPLPAGCVVTFTGTAKSTGAAAGIVVSDGTYTLRSGATEKIRPGVYNVTVSPPPAPPVDQNTIDEYMNTGDASKLPKSPPPPFPAKYSDATNSGLKLDVKEGPNTLDISLTD